MKVTIEFRVDAPAWISKYGIKYSELNGAVLKYIVDQIYMSTASEDGLISKIVAREVES